MSWIRLPPKAKIKQGDRRRLGHTNSQTDTPWSVVPASVINQRVPPTLSAWEYHRSVPERASIPSPPAPYLWRVLLIGEVVQAGDMCCLWDGRASRPPTPWIPAGDSLDGELVMGGEAHFCHQIDVDHVPAEASPDSHQRSRMARTQQSVVAARGLVATGIVDPSRLSEAMDVIEQSIAMLAATEWEAPANRSQVDELARVLEERDHWKAEAARLRTMMETIREAATVAVNVPSYAPISEAMQGEPGVRNFGHTVHIHETGVRVPSILDEAGTIRAMTPREIRDENERRTSRGEPSIVYAPYIPLYNTEGVILRGLEGDYELQDDGQTLRYRNTPLGTPITPSSLVPDEEEV